MNFPIPFEIRASPTVIIGEAYDKWFNSNKRRVKPKKKNRTKEKNRRKENKKRA